MSASDRIGLVWAGSVIIAVLLGLWFIGKAAGVVLMLFAAALFAIFLDTLTAWTQGNTRLSRTWALTAVSLFLLILIAGTFAFAIPPLTTQARELIDQLPQAASQTRDMLERIGVPQSVFQQAGQQSIAAQAAAAAVSTFDMVVAAFIVVVVGLYFAADPRRYRRSLANLFPRNSRYRVNAFLDDLAGTLRRWLMARILLMISNGVLTTIGLWIIGVPLAPILGVAAGLLNFVPNLGPIVASIPAILIGLSQGYSTGLAVAILYLVLQMLDGYVFTPLAEKKAVNLAPAYILAFQVLAGVLVGSAGVVLATPIFAAGSVMLQHLRPKDLVPEDEGPRPEPSPEPLLSRG